MLTAERPKSHWLEKRDQLATITQVQKYEEQSARLDAWAAQWAKDLDTIDTLRAQVACRTCGANYASGQCHACEKANMASRDEEIKDLRAKLKEAHEALRGEVIRVSELDGEH